MFHAALLDDQQQVLGIDLAADVDYDLLNDAAAFAQHGRLHFHGFQMHEHVTLGNDIALFHGNGNDETGHGGGEVSRIARVCLGSASLAR